MIVITFCLARLITVAVRLTGFSGPNVLEAREVVDCLVVVVVVAVASAVVMNDVGVCVVAVAVGRGGLCSTMVPSGLTRLVPFSPPRSRLRVFLNLKVFLLPAFILASLLLLSPWPPSPLSSLGSLSLALVPPLRVPRLVNSLGSEVEEDPRISAGNEESSNYSERIKTCQ